MAYREINTRIRKEQSNPYKDLILYEQWPISRLLNTGSSCNKNKRNAPYFPLSLSRLKQSVPFLYLIDCHRI